MNSLTIYPTIYVNKLRLIKKITNTCGKRKNKLFFINPKKFIPKYNIREAIYKDLINWVYNKDTIKLKKKRNSYYKALDN